MVKRVNEVWHYFSCIPFVKDIRNPYDATFNPFPNRINIISSVFSYFIMTKTTINAFCLR